MGHVGTKQKPGGPNVCVLFRDHTERGVVGSWLVVVCWVTFNAADCVMSLSPVGSLVKAPGAPQAPGLLINCASQ